MILTWYGHACFRLETAEGAAVFDPYEPGSVPGLTLPELSADTVLCSHGHHDHCHARGVRQSKMRPGYTVETVAVFHDDQGGALRGGDTVHIVIAEGKRIVHMGDIGHPLTPAQITAIGTPDVLMVPVGGHYTVDAPTAKGICDALRPRTVIPMHYRGEGFGYDVIGPVTDFTALFDAVTVLDTNALDLHTAPAGVVVLKCPTTE